LSLNGEEHHKSIGYTRSADVPGSTLATDAVHVYNLLWGIPESMGGMTTAALRRIRSFQTYGSPLSQTILTFDPRMDTDAMKNSLVSRGKMRGDVDFVNVWQELRSRTEPELAELRGEPPRAPVPAEDGEVENITRYYDAFRDTRTGGVFRRNYLRKDGSILLVDVQDPELGRRFVLHSPSGMPMTEWKRPRDFYNAWIAAVVTREPAVVIVDDKKVSEFVHEITDRTFSLILFLHGTHLRHPWNGNHGQPLPRRVDTVRNLDRFDVVGVQTEQQAEAVSVIGFREDNIRLLTGELPAESVMTDTPTRRETNNAVMIANLIELKRVDHPIRAVGQLRDRGIDVSLTVLGEGPQRPYLERLIDELGVGDRVELPGYVQNVSERLKSASFSMLTSTSEGLPLSMMEAMGAGCIPIVYDITYGPRDLIAQGRNGFITPSSDVDALAAQIEDFLTIEEERIGDMRTDAKAAVERYLPEASYRRWQAVLEELHPTSLPTAPVSRTARPIEAKRLRCEPTAQGSRLEIEFDQIPRSTAESLELVIAARRVNTFFVSGSAAVSTRRFGRKVVVAFDVDYDSFSESVGETFDVYLRRPRELWTSKRRVHTPKRFQARIVGAWEWYSTKHGNLSVRPRQ
jgi:poly(glycerol-phosphate) alpha-glucosyltransferase